MISGSVKKIALLFLSLMQLKQSSHEVLSDRDIYWTWRNHQYRFRLVRHPSTTGIWTRDPDNELSWSCFPSKCVKSIVESRKTKWVNWHTQICQAIYRSKLQLFQDTILKNDFTFIYWVCMSERGTLEWRKKVGVSEWERIDCTSARLVEIKCKAFLLNAL